MSQNDMITLEKTEKGYEIAHTDVDSGYHMHHYIRTTLKQALKKAKDLQDENCPEYGLRLGEL